MLKNLPLILLVLFISVHPLKASAQMDPRLKTVAFMSGFGAVGGALLGMASKAFNNSDSFGRATYKRSISRALCRGFIWFLHHPLPPYEKKPCQ